MAVSVYKVSLVYEDGEAQIMPFSDDVAARAFVARARSRKDIRLAKLIDPKEPPSGHTQ